MLDRLPTTTVIANQCAHWCGDRRECLWCNPFLLSSRGSASESRDLRTKFLQRIIRMRRFLDSHSFARNDKFGGAVHKCTRRLPRHFVPRNDMVFVFWFDRMLPLRFRQVLGDRKGRPYAADFTHWDGKPVPYIPNSTLSRRPQGALLRQKTALIFVHFAVSWKGHCIYRAMAL